jgi:hypothetical protein
MMRYVARRSARKWGVFGDRLGERVAHKQR